MTNFTNMTQETIARLNIACRYWELAKRYFGSPSASGYYTKAYAILRKEMGANNPMTLELQREMRSY